MRPSPCYCDIEFIFIEESRPCETKIYSGCIVIRNVLFYFAQLVPHNAHEARLKAILKLRIACVVLILSPNNVRQNLARLGPLENFLPQESPRKGRL
jgi:hypothetical protein